MVGNVNSGTRKAKLWRDALNLALNRGGGDIKPLNQIAEQVVAMAINGDIQAIKEIADRLDGKPAQALTIGGDADNPFVVVSKDQKDASFAAAIRANT